MRDVRVAARAAARVSSSCNSRAAGTCAAARGSQRIAARSNVCLGAGLSALEPAVRAVKALTRADNGAPRWNGTVRDVKGGVKHALPQLSGSLWPVTHESGDVPVRNWVKRHLGTVLAPCPASVLPTQAVPAIRGYTRCPQERPRQARAAQRVLPSAMKDDASGWVAGRLLRLSPPIAPQPL